MKALSWSAPIFILVAFSAAPGMRAADKPSAHLFARHDGTLGNQEAALYIAYRDNEPLAKLMKPNERTLDLSAVADAMSYKIDDLFSVTGHGEPWTADELDVAFPPAKPQIETPPWRTIPGVTKVKNWKDAAGKRRGSFGPIQLRKSTDELTKNVQDAKGLTLAYVDNHLLQGTGSWNSEGVFFYPIMQSRQGKPGQSNERTFGPAIGWKLAQTSEVGKFDTEELTYSIPLNVFISPGGTETALWALQAKPYLATDFSGGHRIHGAEATAEFIGQPFGSSLYLGGYRNTDIHGVEYRLRIIPKADYSIVDKTGKHSTRTLDDDWFRLGASSSFDFRIGGATFNPLEIGVTYEFMNDLKGTGNHGQQLKGKATLWLSENAGLSFEYAKGDTPVTDKKVDSRTLGLELKY